MSLRKKVRFELGFSLIEMMVAISLGLVVTGSVLGVFLSTSRNYAIDDQIGRMQENARYAMTILSRDLRMAGFWGTMIDPEKITPKKRVCAPASALPECLDFPETTLALDTDCAPSGFVGAGQYDTWAYDPRVPIEVLSEASDTDANNDFSCIQASEFMQTSGTTPNPSSVLTIKSVQGLGNAHNPAVPLDEGNVFLRTNGVIGAILEYDPDHGVTGVPATGVRDWVYTVHVYYIRNHSVIPGDGIPSLFRKHLFVECTNLDGMGNCTNYDHKIQTEAGALGEGVEHVNVNFGIDTDGDGVANFYEAEPDATDLEQAVTAKIFMLVRSPDEDWAYTNDKTYTLGIDGVGLALTRGPFNDNFHRRVFTSTVVLRNPITLNALNN